MNKKLSLIALITIGVIFTSCEGPEGPQGPAGAKGDTGAQGTAGQTGAAGATGTANVIYSEWLDFPTGNHSSSTNFERVYVISAPKITQAIVDGGLVYTYVKETGGWVGTLPYSSLYTSGGTSVVGSILNFSSITVGNVVFRQKWQTPGTPATSFSTSTKPVFASQLRYIIIPGGTKARVKGLDYSNYEAVKAYYGLKD